MIVTIPYKSNKIGLASLLCMLQPQLKNSDAIYIVDNSSDGSGQAIAEMYGSSRLPIVVERGDYTIYESWNVGIDFMLDNDPEGILVLNDDVVVSATLISNIRRASKMSNTPALVTNSPSRAFHSRRLDQNFTWYNSATKEGDIIQGKWLCGFAFFLKRATITQHGKFDETYKIWFGDSDYEHRIGRNIGVITNEFVFHFGGSSFNYSTVQKQIEKDRRHFVHVHGEAALSHCGLSSD